LRELAIVMATRLLRSLVLACAAAALVPLMGARALAQTTEAKAPDGEGYNGFDLPIGAGFAPPEAPPASAPPTEVDPRFYDEDIPPHSHSVIYVIDRSASMSLPVPPYTDAAGRVVSDGSRLDFVKNELRRSVASLPEGFTFNLIIFSECVTVWKNERVQATDEAKAAALAWIDAIEPDGFTNTAGACARALADKENKVVLLLSDGAPNFLDCEETTVADFDTHRRMIDESNSQRALIHTFGIGLDPDTRQFMSDVAKDGGGSFRELQ
jgi:hypothetical protein